MRLILEDKDRLVIKSVLDPEEKFDPDGAMEVRIQGVHVGWVQSVSTRPVLVNWDGGDVDTQEVTFEITATQGTEVSIG
jgi:hypothetical protein